MDYVSNSQIEPFYCRINITKNIQLTSEYYNIHLIIPSFMTNHSFHPYNPFVLIKAGRRAQQYVQHNKQYCKQRMTMVVCNFLVNFFFLSTFCFVVLNLFLVCCHECFNISFMIFLLDCLSKIVPTCLTSIHIYDIKYYMHLME